MCGCAKLRNALLYEAQLADGRELEAAPGNEKVYEATLAWRMVMAVYDVGDVARLSCVFTKVQAGRRSNVDPPIVKVKVRDPYNKVTVYVFGTDPEVVKDRIGEYHVDVPTALVGAWWHRWIGQGLLGVSMSANEEKLTVEASVFADPS